MIKKLYFAIIFRFTNWTFNFWQALGLHIIPNHFYQPVPDTRFIPESLWDKKSDMIGIEMNDSMQLQRIQDFKSKFYDEYNQFLITPPPQLD
ncbi:MAG TPA: hypothetical protein DCE78_03890 [Bacteroidetes bacterium]|nr:hypothetical protein [Bacteroidota bacterium]